MIELRMGAGDLARTRFAISPLLETTAAVRAVGHPARHAHHVRWLRDNSREPGNVLLPLLSLMPAEGYMPDFLTPPPAGPFTEIEQELEILAGTSPALAEREIRRALKGHPPPPELAAMLRAPPQLPQHLAALMAECWQLLVAPHWPRLRDLLDGDVLARARRLTNGGLDALFDDLHPHVAWDGETLRITKKTSLRRDLRGEGLLLIPSVFVWPEVMVMHDDPWQPTLIYPARGVAALWDLPTAPADGLRRLVGSTRAKLLVALAEPTTTSALARAHRLSKGTVSWHLAVLCQAQLIARRPHGRSVLYERTPLGHTLVSADADARDA